MNIFRYLLLFSASFWISSCDNLTEEIHINEDGSGQYAFYSDMIPGVTKMVESMAGIFADSLSTDQSLEEMTQKNIWKDFPDVIDSVIDYSEFVPDSLLTDRETKELIQKMEFFMEGGRAKGYVNTGFRYKFPDFNDLERVLKKVEENQQSSGAGGGMMPGLNEMKTEIKYELKDNVVSRRVKFLKQPDLAQTDLEMLNMFMADAKMRTIVHLPRKVTDAKGNGIKTTDETTVIFEYNLLDYMLGKISSDFDITIEQ